MLALVASGGMSCLDQSVTGLGERAARLNIAPSFSHSGDAPFVPLASVRFVVSRLPGLEVVIDRVYAFPPGSEALAVDLTVPLISIADRFRVRISAMDALGDTVYTSVVNDVAPSVGSTPGPPTPAPLVYTGSDTLVASVAIAPRDTSVWVGDTARLRATAYLADGTPRPGARVRFSSRDTTMLAVRGDNRLLAKSATAGTWIVVTTANGRMDSTRVAGLARAFPGLARVEAGSDIALTALGDTARLSPVGRDASGAVVSGATFTFATLNSAVATVSSAGLVTGVAVGAADVVASVDGRSDTVRVTVSQVATEVAVTPATRTLTAIGDSVQYSASVRDRLGSVVPGAAVTWSSGNVAVATASATGWARAAGNGSTVVRATSGALVGSAAVVVAQEVATLTLGVDTLRLGSVGATATVVPNPRDRNGFAVTGLPYTYGTTNAAVATAAAGGIVTLHGAGAATVSFTIGGKTAGVVVIGTITPTTPTTPSIPVDARPVSLRITPATATMAVGDTLTLVADLIGGGGLATRVTPAWASADPARVSISAAGLATARAVGTVVLSGTHSAVGGSATITVVPAPVLESFTFSPRALTGVTSSALTFSVSVFAKDAGASGVASVEVTFTAPGGATRSCTAATPTFGSRNSGGWDCAITIPAGSPSGTWRATSVVITGSIARTYDETKLAAFGGTTLEVRP